jgi:hypothetical protein
MTAVSFNDGGRWLSLGLVAVVWIAILNTLRGNVADPDLWGYMAFGRLFWEGPGFPYRDIFSYVPTLDPWVYHEWLTGVLIYPLYKYLGALGPQVLKYVLGLATAVVIYATARTRGADPVSAALVLWITQLFLVIGYSPVRAQVFTHFFFVLNCYLLERARLQGRWRPLALLVPVMVLWCNLHGGFVAGLGLLGIYALGEAIGRRPFSLYLALLALCLLATLVNPYGLKYWSYILHAVTMPRSDISEWFSVYRAYQLGRIGGNTVYYLSIAVFAILLAVWARWREITPALALAVTLSLGLKSVRHQVFFIMLCGAYLPRLLQGFLETLKSRASLQSLWAGLGWRPLALLLTVVGLMNTYGFLRNGELKIKVPPLPGLEPRSKMYYPLGALDHLKKRGLSGKLLSEFEWGEYVLWDMFPQVRVALDGRYETVYPDEVAQEYFDFIFGRPGWRRFLEHYPPDMLLLSPKSPAYRLVLQDGGWRQVYGDPGSVLLLREKATSQQ